MVVEFVVAEIAIADLAYPLPMPPLPGARIRWHLIKKPRAPFVCDVCGQTIPESELHTFTTLPKMYYDTPPAGYEPCYTSFDAMKLEYSGAVDREN